MQPARRLRAAGVADQETIKTRRPFGETNFVKVGNWGRAGQGKEHWRAGAGQKASRAAGPV